MAKRISFYIGLNDKDTKTQKINTLAAFQIVENIFNTFCEYGATIRECKGIYKHENGEKVIENTLEAFTYDLTDETIQAIAKMLKDTLNQESILVSKRDETIDFI